MLNSNNKNAISNAEKKTELLVKTFVKLHSTENLSSTAKQCRDQTLAQNPGIVERRTCHLLYLSSKELYQTHGKRHQGNTVHAIAC